MQPPEALRSGTGTGWATSWLTCSPLPSACGSLQGPGCTGSADAPAQGRELAELGRAEIPGPTAEAQGGPESKDTPQRGQTTPSLMGTCVAYCSLSVRVSTVP